MSIAIKEAKEALFPFGAVLVYKDKVIAKSGSGSKDNLDPTAHAEINVIRKTCKKLKTKSLRGMTLYSTCEPCPMCFSACWFVQIKKIVFGVDLKDSSKLFGEEINVSASFLNKKGKSRIIIQKGVLKEEILKLYRKA